MDSSNEPDLACSLCAIAGEMDVPIDEDRVDEYVGGSGGGGGPLGSSDAQDCWNR